jgi:glyoxylase-like metal-dependent hydrolase (beta-lactamase superfamily II)
MIYTRTIGDIRITNLIEYYGPTHDPAATYPDFEPGLMARNRAWLTNNHWYENIQRLVIAIQIWIVQAGDKVVLIDTGVGNHKPRPAARMHMLNSLVPQWLAAAGAGFDQVTHVVMTHLHGDHVGWNTVRRDGGWAPAFPKARYFIPRLDLDYFRDAYLTDPEAHPSFADSVQPIIDAGLAEFVDDGDGIAGCLKAVFAPGHTPGHMNYWIGDEAVFCADLFHHPLQIAEPQLNTAFCILPDVARATRLAFLDRVADKPILVMPCHFGAPHCGRIRRSGQGFAFEPVDPELPQRN